MAETYIALERVRHSVTRKYYQPGEVIPVDHVSPSDLAALVERGVLRKVSTNPPVETVGPITPDEPVIEGGPISKTRSTRKEGAGNG